MANRTRTLKHEFGGLLVDGAPLRILKYRCSNCGIWAWGTQAVAMEGMECPGR